MAEQAKVDNSKCIKCKHCKYIAREYSAGPYVYCRKMSSSRRLDEIVYCSYYKEKKHNERLCKK